MSGVAPRRTSSPAGSRSSSRPTRTSAFPRARLAAGARRGRRHPPPLVPGGDALHRRARPASRASPGAPRARHLRLARGPGRRRAPRLPDRSPEPASPRCVPARPGGGLSDATLVRLSLGRGRLDARVLAGALPAGGPPDEARAVVSLRRPGPPAPGGAGPALAGGPARGRLGGARHPGGARGFAARGGAARKPGGGPPARRAVGRARAVRIRRPSPGAWSSSPTAIPHRRSRRWRTPGRARRSSCSRCTRPRASSGRWSASPTSGASRPPTTGRLLVDPRTGLAFRPTVPWSTDAASHSALGRAGGVARQPRAGREPAGPLRRDDPGPRSPRALGHPGAWRPAHLGGAGSIPVLDVAGGSPAGAASRRRRLPGARSAGSEPRLSRSIRSRSASPSADSSRSSPRRMRRCRWRRSMRLRDVAAASSCGSSRGTGNPGSAPRRLRSPRGTGTGTSRCSVSCWERSRWRPGVTACPMALSRRRSVGSG